MLLEDFEKAFVTCVDLRFSQHGKATEDSYVCRYAFDKTLYLPAKGNGWNASDLRRLSNWHLNLCWQPSYKTMFLSFCRRFPAQEGECGFVSWNGTSEQSPVSTSDGVSPDSSSSSSPSRMDRADTRKPSLCTPQAVDRSASAAQFDRASATGCAGRCLFRGVGTGRQLEQQTIEPGPLDTTSKQPRVASGTTSQPSSPSLSSMLASQQRGPRPRTSPQFSPTVRIGARSEGEDLAFSLTAQARDCKPEPTESSVEQQAKRLVTPSEASTRSIPSGPLSLVLSPTETGTRRSHAEPEIPDRVSVSSLASESVSSLGARMPASQAETSRPSTSENVDQQSSPTLDFEALLKNLDAAPLSGAGEEEERDKEEEKEEEEVEGCDGWVDSEDNGEGLASVGGGDTGKEGRETGEGKGGENRTARGVGVDDALDPSVDKTEVNPRQASQALTQDWTWSSTSRGGSGVNTSDGSADQSNSRGEETASSKRKRSQEEDCGHLAPDA
eukprot:235899-Rhodomonas_salina.1